MDTNPPVTPRRPSCPSPTSRLPALIALTLCSTLTHAATIGGKVTEDDGSPIPAARVLVHAEPATQPDRTATTDASGNWSLDNIPEDAAISVAAFHPAYELPDRLTPARTLKADLLAKEQILHLARAQRLDLTVLGPDGKPLPNATVSLLAPPDAPNPPTAQTGPAGTLTLGLKPGQSTLIVQAPNLAPRATPITLENDSALTIDLHHGDPLVARIEDAAGKAIPDAVATPIRWAAVRGNPGLARSFTTNAKGEFEWPDAPPEPLTFRITAPGFLVNPAVTMKARSDNRATLVRQAPIHIHIEDATTHQPLKDFQLSRATFTTPTAAPLWHSAESAQKDPPTVKRLAPGLIEATETDALAAVAFRAKNPDYLPAETPPIPLDGKPHELTLALKPGQHIVGTLLTPDNKPLPNTRLRILPAANPPVQTLDALLSPAEEKKAPDQFTTTDPAGHFSLPPQAAAYTLLAQSDAGYLLIPSTSITPAAALSLRLSPWAKVEGTLLQGARPASAGTWVTFRSEPFPDDPQNNLAIQSAAQTDRAGKFTLARLIAGPFSATGPGAPPEFATAVAGESLSLQLGGTGRTVTGKLTLPLALSGKPWILDDAPQIEIALPLPTIELPPDILKSTPEERDAFYAQWRKSSAGQAYAKAQAASNNARRKYHLALQPNGDFRIDSLPPGTYQLHLTFLPKPQNPDPQHPTPDTRPPLAEADYVLPLPEAPATQPSALSTQPSAPVADVGTLAPTTPYAYLLHQPAPDFFMTRLDGKPLTLSSFKGKPLLLIFWSTTTFSHADEQSLTSLFNTLGPAAGKPGQIEILGLNTDPDPATAKAFVTAHIMPWTQASIGPHSFPAHLYNLHSLPTYIALTADQKVLAITHTPTTLQQLFTPPK